MSLSNRRTHKKVELSGARTPMAPKIGVFAVTYRSPMTQIFEFVESRLPYGMKQEEKIALFDMIRIAFAGREKELAQVLDDPDTYYGALVESLKQKQMPDEDTANGNAALSAVTTLGRAKVDALAPGLLTVGSILLGGITAAAAQPYEFVSGQPVGGKDLCEGSLYQCIQGHLQQLGIWNSTLPQSASETICNVTGATPCVDEQTLGAMTKRAFFAPSADVVACNINQQVDQARNLTFKITALDQVGCNIAKDSVIGAAKNCADKPIVPDSPLKLGLLIGVGIGLPLLAVTGLIICKKVRDRSKDAERVMLVNH